VTDAYLISKYGETSQQPLAKRNSHVAPPLDFALTSMTSWPLCSPTERRFRGSTNLILQLTILGCNRLVVSLASRVLRNRRGHSTGLQRCALNSSNPMRSRLRRNASQGSIVVFYRRRRRESGGFDGCLVGIPPLARA